jgi:hypothetical protein
MNKSITEEDLYKITMAGYGRMRPDLVPLFLWGTFVFTGAVVGVSLFGVIQAELPVNPMLLTAVRVMIMVLGGQLLLNILFSIPPIAYALQKSQIIFDLYINCIFFKPPLL